MGGFESESMEGVSEETIGNRVSNRHSLAYNSCETNTRACTHIMGGVIQ